jgi:DNA helicase-2/ATP-dependent DNA helicase PcrA
MISLNPEQTAAVAYDGNVVVTACPGSGKTRVLTARVMRGLDELKSSRERVIALTFTNRAADEIQSRMDREHVDASRLWAGTIHSFALEWILRPYAPYSEITTRGFSVADEFYTDRLLKELKAEEGLSPFAEINTTIDRTGTTFNVDNRCRAVFARYKERLRSARLIDYDDVLFVAYRLLASNREIASTIGSITRLICVDEVQDIQDLQYGILSAIYRAAFAAPCVFFVGDAHQSIYESLGALTKTPAEIAAEFGIGMIRHLELRGNYRSTQRIIDFYSRFREGIPRIQALAAHADHIGKVTFDDQTILAEDLAPTIAALIKASIESGIPANDICVLAPQWWHVRSLARRLVVQLPNIEFDAPGLSPLYSSRDNLWFKVGRLLLTSPSPSRTRTRYRWANEVLSDLAAFADVSLPDEVTTPRRLLRLMNSISSNETDGIAYLREVFSHFLNRIRLDISACAALSASFDVFFEKAGEALRTADGSIPGDVNSFRRFFSHPSGVVVSTCHGVKGEEYDTVIAFGLLRGYVPHWDVIINGSDELAADRESKLLYVICSRAKRHLYLIAETGRFTQKGRAYETARLLRGLEFDYG